ncbi:MAG: hypothetical protein IJA20_08610 [Methanocorpusculum sp.]|nr:hypothetical protein [Oscillospiraceae bacterium]MBQ3570715.1 hypothetical protein [Methanocorpusculum sp.]
MSEAIKWIYDRDSGVYSSEDERFRIIKDTGLVYGGEYELTDTKTGLEFHKPRLKDAKYVAASILADEKRAKYKASVETQIKAYLDDPSTRVIIVHNNELQRDRWMYSVEVVGSDGFWLDAFPSEVEAKRYISEHGLQLIASGK